MENLYLDPNDQPYFFGRLSRLDAEFILEKLGRTDGLFLLREHLNNIGSYVLSLCFENNIYHCIIDRLSNEKVEIECGKEFIGPIELINHYRTDPGGLVTKLLLECKRPADKPPIGYFLINNKILNSFIIDEMKLSNIPNRLRFKAERRVLDDFHRYQIWFKPNTNYSQAESLFAKIKPINGQFLIRCDKICGNIYEIETHSIYRLTLYVDGMIKHFVIETEDSPDGHRHYFKNNDKKFSNLIHLVDHYYRFKDGLPCKLELPIHRDPLLDVYPYWLTEYGRVETNDNRDYILMDYGFDIKEEQLEEEGNIIGQGNFGIVKKALYSYTNQNKVVKIQVALKQLKKLDNENKEDEILHEAELLSRLEHNHLIKFYGACFKKDGVLSLVLEYAALGSFDAYLRSNPSYEMCKIVKICYQVASAMSYLARNNIVHRDLACRNILLLSEETGKLSDFGLSRLVITSYYVSSIFGRWPVRWYPPESIIERKFDELTDVWSFGVTCWEATSYGKMPYDGVDDRLALEMVRRGEIQNHHPKPKNCSNRMYRIMLKCWRVRKERVNFEKISDDLKDVYKSLYNKELAEGQFS